MLVIALVGCGPTSANAPRTVALEFAEIGSSGTTRHLYDQAGKPTDLIVASSLPATGIVTGVLAGEHQVTLDLSKADSDKLKEWSGQRMDREMAVFVGDQVLMRATIKGALWGKTALPIPSDVRSPDLRAAIEHAMQDPRK